MAIAMPLLLTFPPPSAVFNLGEYRRNVTQAYRNHDFFRPDNNAAMAIRATCAKHALEDVVSSYQLRNVPQTLIHLIYFIISVNGLRMAVGKWP